MVDEEEPFGEVVVVLGCLVMFLSSSSVVGVVRSGVFSSVVDFGFRFIKPIVDWKFWKMGD